MRLCRYNDNRLGLLRGDKLHDVSSILGSLSPLAYPVPWGDHLIANLSGLRSEMERLADKATPTPAAEAKFLSPVANPSKIIGTPVNYHLHALEGRADPDIAAYANSRPHSIMEQGLFLKACSSLVGPCEGITLRYPDRRTDHEAELGVVIGKKTANISAADALSCVAGYAIALDMVVRGKEDRSFRKSPDSYAVLGPWLVTADELPDPSELDFSLTVNGEVRQKANTREMIIDVPTQIAWASSNYTLYPGDIIMTGTCQGVGPVKPGDTIRVEFERIGAMDVPVKG